MKRAPEGGLEGLRTRSRTPRGLIALVAVGIVAASVPALAPAAAPSSTPDPKELWDSYPLGGGGAAPDPAPTPTPSATASATPTAAPAEPAAAPRDDGSWTAVVIGGSMVAFAFGIGAGEVWRRRRRAAATPIAPAAPAAAAPAAAARPAPPAPEPVSPPPAAAPVAQRARPRPKPAQPARPRPKPAQPARPRPKPARPPRVRPEPEPAEAWLEPVPPAPAPASAPAPARRFASAWPEDARDRWTCEIDWKAGYRASSFRAMAGPPGATKRHPLGESSAGRWTLMADPEPPTPELVACVRDLSDALQAAGWDDAGRGRHWYALRFVWTHTEDPRPLEPQTRKAKHV
jgi:hypothetical protein